MLEFKTIQEHVEAEITQKKSKFIADLFPVASVKEAKMYIKEIKKKYYDAKHHCLAYRVIEDEKITQKASDDGEPSGTAGAPMLQILQKNELANILIVVTRYFGGILLGTGGLVRAYSDSLLKAIQESHILNMSQGFEILVKIDYSELAIFEHYCKKNQILLKDMTYEDVVSCKIQLQENKKEEFMQNFETKATILRKIYCEK